MSYTYLLARDHLEQAAVILQGGDQRSQQLRTIIDRTVALLDEFRRQDRGYRADNVLDFAAFKHERRKAAAGGQD